MIQYEHPSPQDGDEDRYEAAPALCDVCGNTAGEVARDGDWVCSRCDAALEVDGE